jgi:hypothetical protein
LRIKVKMSVLKRSLLKWLTKAKYQKFVKDTHNPEGAKTRLWHNEILPLLHQGTYWPGKFDLGLDSSLDLFEITSYENYAGALIAALSSSVQPLNGEEILFWSETSATTGNRKYFPITKSFQQQFQRTMPPYFYSLINRYPDFLKKKILYLAAWETGVFSPANIPMGLISHYNYKNLPPLIQSFYALPQEVFKDEATFKQWAPVYALAQDLSAVFAVVPIVLDNFIKTCVANFNIYLPYLLKEKALPAELPPLKMSKQRHNYLKNMNTDLSIEYKKIWPGLTVMGCWIEGPCKTYALKLAKEIGRRIDLLDGTYSATEGWLTVPIDVKHKGGVYHPGTHIAEFIEEGGDISKDKLLQSWQLKPGEKYEIFLTTAMGFVRYRLKDVVECTGYFNKAPILSFCYKVSSLLLDYCSLSECELRVAVTESNINLEPYWFFACDAKRNRLYFVVDKDAKITEHHTLMIHQQLLKKNDKYAYESQHNNILPCKLLKLAKKKLLKNHHAQTKPKIISQDILSLE